MERGGLLRTNVGEQVHHFLRPSERFASCALEDSELAIRPVDFHEDILPFLRKKRDFTPMMVEACIGKITQHHFSMIHRVFVLQRVP